MIAQLDTTRLHQVGQSSDTTFYLLEDRILAGVPLGRTSAGETAALSNIDFVHGYFREHGPGLLLVFIDILVMQDRDNRETYHARLDPSLLIGVGMIGGTMLARAIGSVFLGIGRGRVVFKLFASLSPALEWARAKRPKEI